MRKPAFWLIPLALLAALSALGWHYWQQEQARAERWRCPHGYPVFPNSDKRDAKGFLGAYVQFPGQSYHGKQSVGSGSAVLQGSARVEGIPQPGLKLRLYLNGSRATEWATTDSQGSYSIPLPAGEYRISGFELARDSADELLLGLIHKAPYRFNQTFTLADGQTGTGLDFRFVTPVRRTLQQTEYRVDEPIPVQWQAYLGASYYKIQVLEIEDPYEEGGVQRIFPFGDRPRTITTELDLRELYDGFKPGYFYRYVITAFDEQDRPIASSGRKHVDVDFLILP
ncbi:carboxypeptidase-like regulatory domain-containing protein [Ferrimonas marina]|uniref:Uncharacterized protein n=1 Tax=Ferrimonas marina TaxID=299255 RepID=A0A1M5X3C6_9GAMM|nr:carboxypeptidase-like regulatory domain-containing protein [Ferrimonas marina]SHH94337.1 hypothetical protein SAMN02745129_3193 [Ferrimonas marina]